MYTESHQELGQHPKLLRLASLLKVSDVQAVGHLHFLWWWALSYAPDGNLAGWEAGEIAAGAHWTGDPDVFLTALLTCGRSGKAGFAERSEAGVTLHDWAQYGGKLFATREKDRLRKASVRKCPSDVQRTHAAQSAGSPAEVQRTSGGSPVDVRRRVEKSREDGESVCKENTRFGEEGGTGGKGPQAVQRKSGGHPVDATGRALLDMLARLFQRGTFSADELSAVSVLSGNGLTTQDVDLVGRVVGGLTGEERQTFPQSVGAFLAKWGDILDRCRVWRHQIKGGKRVEDTSRPAAADPAASARTALLAKRTNEERFALLCELPSKTLADVQDWAFGQFKGLRAVWENNQKARP